ncbi:metallophosphoesterase [Sporolactobacillus sp. THM7-7]|nr:metallophosphoesterase [Sporolactobacillus sp. THM7-7]
MKWLIVSDTHGMTREVADLKMRYKGKVEAFIHCGDSELDPEASEIQDYLTVEGNCDFPGAYPDESVQRLGPLKFLVAHGHLLDVRRSPAKLLYRGLEENVQVVCFGHTHVAETFKEAGVLFINPGSLRLPRNYREGTYVILDLEPGQKEIAVHYYNYSGRRVDQLSKTFDWYAE